MSKTERSAPLPKSAWTGAQAYILAGFCLVLGVALGYLFRGSASPAAASAAGNSVNQAVAPLLAALKNNPDDFNTLVQVANLYYDGKQYPDAVKYYQLAVKGQPTNPDVLTDLGTSLWYLGDADGAIKNFEKALKYRPDHPGTLFNLGVVRWQGKLDPKGAIAAWEELLRLNPNYPQKQEVQEFIDRARQHAKG